MPHHRLLAALAMASTAISLPVRADTVSVFQTSGAFQQGQTMIGTITIDTTSGVIQGANINVDGQPTFSYVANQYPISSTVQYVEITSPGQPVPGYPYLNLLLPASLVDYAGGYIIPQAYGVAPGGTYPIQFYSGVGTLTQPSPGNLTSGYMYAQPSGCSQAITAGKLIWQYAQNFTAIQAEFIPTTYTPNPSQSLAQAALACGVTNFDWQQTVTNLPPPSPAYLARSHNTNLLAPPNFLDPPLGGYFFRTESPSGYGRTDTDSTMSFPFYWSAQNLYTAPGSQTYNLCAHEVGGQHVEFEDQPHDPDLPKGGVITFITSLVGVLPSNTPTAPLATFTWESNYTGPPLFKGQLTILNSGPFADVPFSTSTTACTP